MLFLLMTALAVSVDAFVAGLAYNLKRKMNLMEVIYAGSFTFIACLLALLLGKVLLPLMPFVNLIGALVFICLGIRNFYYRDDEVFNSVKSGDSSVALLGIAVATDAAIACLTINLCFSQMPLYALVMCLGHTLFLGLSRLCVRIKSVSYGFSIISGVSLIVIGVLRLL